MQPVALLLALGRVEDTRIFAHDVPASLENDIRQRLFIRFKLAHETSRSAFTPASSSPNRCTPASHSERLVLYPPPECSCLTMVLQITMLMFAGSGSALNSNDRQSSRMA